MTNGLSEFGELFRARILWNVGCGHSKRQRLLKNNVALVSQVAVDSRLQVFIKRNLVQPS